jgi:hypothetical protein
MNIIPNFYHTIYNENDNENDTNEVNDDDESDNDSPLRDIYTGQTFTTFEILKTCLRRYANNLGFEIKTVRCEKENGIWARKTYKCHHGGKYEPKKNVDLTHNQN